MDQENNIKSIVITEQDVTQVLSGDYKEKFPKWAKERYPGQEKDFLAWITLAQLESPMLHAIAQGLEGENFIAQIVALAKQQAIEILSSFPDLSEGALMAAIETGLRERWFEDLPVPLANMEEVFMNIAEGYGEKTTAYYDFLFVAQTVIPAMDKLDIDSEVFWRLPQSRSKLRAAVPLLKESIPGTHYRAPEKFSLENQQVVRDILETIADPQVAVRDFRETVKEKRGVVIQKPIPPDAEEFAMGDGQTWFLIECTTPAQAQLARRHVEKVSGNIRLGDILSLAKQVSTKLTGVKTGSRIVDLEHIKNLVNMEGDDE